MYDYYTHHVSFNFPSQTYLIICREGTFFLVIDHFNNDVSDILSQLHTHPRSLFLYLKTLIEVHLSGSVNFSCLKKDFGVNYSTKGLDDYFQKLSDFPKYLSNNPVDVADDIIELYVEVSLYSVEALNRSVTYLTLFFPFNW